MPGVDLKGNENENADLNLKCSIFRNLFNVTPEFKSVDEVNNLF